MYLILSFIYYLLMFFNALLALKGKRNKIIAVITVIFLGLLFCCNLGSEGDHEAYKYEFLNSDLQLSNDSFFDTFCTFIRGLGVASYPLFLLCVWVMIITLSRIGTKGFVNNYHTVFALCMPYIAPHLGVALRFVIALSVFLFSLRFLLNKKIGIYILCSIIAGLFHASFFIALLFIPFSVCFNKNNDRINRIFIGAIFVVALILSYFTISSSSLPYLTQILAIVDGSSIESRSILYLNDEVNKGGFLVIPIYCIGILTVFYWYKAKRKFKLVLNNNKGENVEKFTIYVNCILALFIPLALISEIFIRLFFIQTIINAIYLNSFANLNISLPQKRMVKLFLLMYMCAWAFLSYIKLFDISISNWLKTATYFLQASL